tara:strand:- start:161861 stop:162553 length:693 start_codon:yes stop_codon:yes gene_type:complete
MKINWKLAFASLLAGSLLNSCIGDDIIEDEIKPSIRILNPVDSIEINQFYDFQASVFDNTGLMLQNPELNWTSSDTAILEIKANGQAFAKKMGNSLVKVSWLGGEEELVDENIVAVGLNTVQQLLSRKGSLQTTSSYQLQGDFNLSIENGTTVLNLESNYKASSNLPGLFVYLTNNPSTSAGAFEIGPASTFSGAHSYILPASVGLNDYQYLLYFCKPFNVKVGDGKFDN